MGTQFDALGHQGHALKMADGSIQFVYSNGFTEEDLTGANGGVGGLQALGVEHVKPIITRGMLIDIAAYKGVPALDSLYEVSLADVRGALARQNISEDSSTTSSSSRKGSTCSRTWSCAIWRATACTNSCSSARRCASRGRPDRPCGRSPFAERRAGGGYRTEQGVGFQAAPSGSFLNA